MVKKDENTNDGHGQQNIEKNKGNAKRGVTPRLNIWPGDLDIWPMILKVIRFS